MEALRFTLKGKNAFFKKPEVNSYVYFTYGNIHKVSLLGIFGAILGYGGYAQKSPYIKSKKAAELIESYPEFYERLKDLKIAVIPSENNKNGVIPKKIQSFNNSVGYASKELGGNLIIKEQWLENPEWEICVLLDCEEALKIKDSICNHKCVYYPYLGKNDHFADILNISVEKINKTENDLIKVSSMVPEKNIEITDLDDDELDDLEDAGIDAYGSFVYKELLPVGMDGWTNKYVMEKMMLTDYIVNIRGIDVYELNDHKQVVFI